MDKMEIKVSFSIIRIFIVIWCLTNFDVHLATWADLSQYKGCLQMSPRINEYQWNIEETKILGTDHENHISLITHKAQ